jgi:AcrR family transcriptional regulator
MPPSKKKSDLSNPVLLKQIATSLFAKYSYEGTTVRMIAKSAGLSQGQVTVHFGSKEKLFHSIVEDVISDTLKVFDPIIADIERMRSEGLLDKHAAYTFIEKIIDLQINFALDPDNHDALMLVLIDTDSLSSVQSNLARTFVEKIEHILALLIATYSEKPGYLRARTISRAINGAIISFGEHKDLLIQSVYGSKYAPNSATWMHQYLKDFIMASIEAARNVEMR